MTLSAVARCCARYRVWLFVCMIIIYYYGLSLCIFINCEVVIKWFQLGVSLEEYN